MKTKILILFIVIFTLPSSVQAQKRRGGESIDKVREQYPHFDIEKHQKERANYIVKVLELTDTEKEKFLPLMDEYIQARFELSKDKRNAVRELKTKQNGAESDYQKVIDISLDVRIKEAELLKEYYKKFGEILPAKKLIKYDRAEREFMDRTIKHYHKREEK